MTENAKSSWIENLTNGQPLADLLATAKTHGANVAAGSDTNGKSGTALAATIPNLHVGQGQRFGNLTWFPVWTDAPVTSRKYVGASPQNLKLAELPSAQVNTVLATNDTDLDILLFEGMILEAGWQHRSLTRTTLVPRQSTVPLAVVCVERSRWGGAGEQRFGSKVAPIRVKRAMRGMRRNADGLAMQSAPDQSDVWQEVHQYSMRHNIAADNESMVDLDNKLQAAGPIAGGTAPLPKATPLYGQRGVIVAALGKPIALELFDHPDTLAERFEGLLQSYQLDVADQRYVETRGQAARDFAVAITVAKLSEVQDGTAPETTKRLRNGASKKVAAEALAIDELLVHLSGINPQHELVLAA